jgi:hypothetical protein
MWRVCSSACADGSKLRNDLGPLFLYGFYISRSLVLNAIVILILLATVPGAIHRIVQSGDPYLFSKQFYEDMWHAFLDLVVSASSCNRSLPLWVSVMVRKTRGHGFRSFFWNLAFHSERIGLLRSAYPSVRNLVAIAILWTSLRNF